MHQPPNKKKLAFQAAKAKAQAEIEQCYSEHKPIQIRKSESTLGSSERVMNPENFDTFGYRIPRKRRSRNVVEAILAYTATGLTVEDVDAMNRTLAEIKALPEVSQ